MLIKRPSGNPIHVAVSSLFFMLFFSGCGAPPPQETTPAGETAETTPAFDMDAAMQQETAPLPVVAVGDQKGSWTGAIEARMNPMYAADENYTSVEVSIGTTSPVTCIVYNHVIDPASSLVTIMKSSFETAQLQVAELSTVDVINGVPAMILEGLYTVEENGQRAAGVLKLALFDAPEHPAICIHDELGYRNSFRRITFSFFESLRVANPQEAPPTFNQIWRTSIQQTTVGFTREQVQCNADGTCLTIFSSAMILAVSPTQIFSIDEFHSRSLDKKGIVTEAMFTSNENGVVNTQLQLKQLKKKSYSYEGKYRGADLKGEFSTALAAGLEGPILQKRHFAKQIATGAAGTISSEEYVPSVDSAKTITVSYALTPSADGPLLAATVGGNRLTGIADPAGNLISGDMTSGDAVLRLEPLLLEGTLPALP